MTAYYGLRIVVEFLVPKMSAFELKIHFFHRRASLTDGLGEENRIVEARK